MLRNFCNIPVYMRGNQNNKLIPRSDNFLFWLDSKDYEFTCFYKIRNIMC